MKFEYYFTTVTRLRSSKISSPILYSSCAVAIARHIDSSSWHKLLPFFLVCLYLYIYDCSFFVFSFQVNYSNFMHGLMKENIQLNRKVLSELSMHEPYSFKALVDVSRNAFPGNRAPKKEGLSIAAPKKESLSIVA